MSCKYCDLIPSMDGMISFGKDLPLEDDNGYMFVFEDEECHYGLCYHDYEDNEHIVDIKYCPMCGRKLTEEEL